MLTRFIIILKHKLFRSYLFIIRSFRIFFEKLFFNVWSENPMIKTPTADRQKFIELFEDSKKVSYPEIDKYEEEMGYPINVNWMNELALHTQIVIKKSPLCYSHGRILYSTLSNYINVNKNLDNLFILETGTSRGFSALCMAKALKDNNRSGKIITFDVLPHDSKIFWNCIDDFEGKKTRRELLFPWNDLASKYVVFHQGDSRIEMQKVKFGRVNFAFLDGFHTYDDVMFEFSQIKDFQENGDIIVFDDYTPSLYPGLVEAVDKICNQFNYKSVKIKSSYNRGYVIGVKENI